MQPKFDPFNIKLLKLTLGQTRILQPVLTLDRMDGLSTTDFHPNGLFSTEIFGRVGEDRRDYTFSYIPLRTTIFHPVIYRALERLKRLYVGIMTGKEFAVWDAKEKDFIKATAVDGETGYQFFMSHWHELTVKPGTSEVRKQRVALINKYREEAVIDNVLVMPAGIRDLEIGPDGRSQEDEINDHYRRLISITNTIGKSTDKESEVLNTARVGMQQTFNDIYALIETMLTGKKGYLQGKFATRVIADGTRNVITAMDISAPNLESKNYPGPDDTVMGLWQVSRGAQPLTVAKLKNGVLATVFGDVEGSVRLIDPKTLESELVQPSSQTFDRWTTREGLEKVIASQSMVELRAKPVKIEGRYLALVYKPKNEKVFKVFFDIRELPENLSKKDVYPITYVELIYLCNYRDWNKLKVISTRYPVTGEDSAYASNVFLKTTINSEARVELGEDWIPLPADENTAEVYPLFEPEAYVDSAQVHLYRLKGLGGD